MRPRPELHETKIETETNYYKTETQDKKVLSRPHWSRDLNIPVYYAKIFTVTKPNKLPKT